MMASSARFQVGMNVGFEMVQFPFLNSILHYLLYFNNLNIEISMFCQDIFYSLDNNLKKINKTKNLNKKSILAEDWMDLYIPVQIEKVQVKKQIK